MHVLLVTLDLEIPGAFSLKDKRSVIKGIQARIRQRHNAAIAEVDHQDKWNRATLALVTVATLESTVESVMRQIEEELEANFDVVVLGFEREWL